MALTNDLLDSLTPAEMPDIRTNKRFHRDIVSDCRDAISSVNDDDPFLFQQDGRFVEITIGDFGQPRIEPVSKASLRHLLDRCANFVTVVEGEDKNTTTPDHPLDKVVAVLAEQAEKPVPRLTGVITTPVFVSEHKLLVDDGYDPESQLYLMKEPSLCIPEIPEEPELVHVEAAVHTLWELVCDFPFVEQSDADNAFAALILPFVRPMINGPTPLFMVTSPTPGTGKSLLVEILNIPAAGRSPSLLPRPKGEDEWSRRILAVLSPGPIAVTIDNISGKLDSPTLASALTARLWEDRIVGSSVSASVPIRSTWFATANNPSLSPELARRTVVIGLDRQMENPHEWSGFKHPNVVEWAIEHRGRLIEAVLTIVKYAADEGWPKADINFGSYEEFASLIGGILENAGIDGFYDNHAKAFETLADERSEWIAFTREWYEEHEDQPVTAAELYSFVIQKQLVASIVVGKTESSAKVALGKSIANRRGQIFDGLVIETVGIARSGSGRYRLIKQNQETSSTRRVSRLEKSCHE